MFLRSIARIIQLEKFTNLSNIYLNQQVGNVAFTTIASASGGAILPAAGTAVGAATTTNPAGWVALGAVTLGYDIAIAQGTFNNIVEGQSFWPAFWDARAKTHETLTFGKITSDEIDAAIDKVIGPVFNTLGDGIVWVTIELKKDP